MANEESLIFTATHNETGAQTPPLTPVQTPTPPEAQYPLDRHLEADTSVEAEIPTDTMPESEARTLLNETVEAPKAQLPSADITTDAESPTEPGAQGGQVQTRVYSIEV